MTADLSPEAIIAEHRWSHRLGGCVCGWTALYPNTHKSGIELHAAHVVSRLRDAGHTIVPSGGVVDDVAELARELAVAANDGCFDREPDDEATTDAEDRKYWTDLATAGLERLRTLRRVDAGQFFIEFDCRSDGGPLQVGTFESRSAADAYVKGLGRVDASWCVVPLAAAASPTAQPEVTVAQHENVAPEQEES